MFNNLFVKEKLYMLYTMSIRAQKLKKELIKYKISAKVVVPDYWWENVRAIFKTQHDLNFYRLAGSIKENEKVVFKTKNKKVVISQFKKND